MLVARRGELMEEVAAELRTLYPMLEVHVVVADLAKEEGCDTVVAEVLGRSFHPSFLINNAGLGDYGDFSGASLERVRTQMNVNMGAIVSLTHQIGPLLQRPGAVLNVSSLAGGLLMPGMAVYAATKAFVTSFTESLAMEWRSQDITVSCVCPGPTPTSFGLNARRPGGGDTNRSGQAMLAVPPEQVVRDALKCVESGGVSVYPGTMVKLAAFAFRLMPRRCLRFFMSRRYETTPHT